jgi:Rps23 Pro-64 3,4-dihydroxylase Tpa1-like proline 4-hydroxylase
MINPDLDIKTLAKEFKTDKRLMVPNFMQQSIAERMRNACLKDVPFSMHYVIDDKYQSKTPEEIAKLSPQDARDINNKVSSAASQGIGFLYEGYLKSRINTDPNKQSNVELSFLHRILDYLSSEDVLSKIRQVTGCQEITGAETQYTRFTPGHFLTRHLDVIAGSGRRFAFVLGLTKDWHPDWGGLLQFYEKDGTPRDAWAPQFNVLSIFDVSHIHSVTYVTPYAAAPRLSLTGWFVAKD